MKNLLKGGGVWVSLAVEVLFKLIRMGYEYYLKRKAEKDGRSESDVQESEKEIRENDKLNNKRPGGEPGGEKEKKS